MKARAATAAALAVAAALLLAASHRPTDARMRLEMPSTPAQDVQESEVQPTRPGEGQDGAVGSLPDGAIAWLSVPGTPISCPVAQAPPDDPARYEHRSLDGAASEAGCAYLDASCSSKGLDSPAPLIFGHNMADGSMFAPFARYSDEAYARSHSQIILATEEHEIVLQVVGVNLADADTERARTGFANNEELNAYLAARLEESEVVISKPDSIERLYTFCTCSYQTPHSRTIIYAVENAQLKFLASA